MKPPSRSGYTFIEVMVASALIGVVIGGAVSLAATMNLQGEAASTSAVALNFHDNAARLWQLGLTPAEVQAVMPHITNNEALESAIVPYGSSPGTQVSFTGEGTTALSNSMGTLQDVTCSVTVRSPVGSTHRVVTAEVYRPSIR